MGLSGLAPLAGWVPRGRRRGASGDALVGLLWRRRRAHGHGRRLAHSRRQPSLGRCGLDQRLCPRARLDRLGVVGLALAPAAFPTLAPYPTSLRITASYALIPGPASGTQKPRPKSVQPNYRMKLTSSAVGWLGGTDNPPAACSLARARLGAQLMRGR